MELSDLRDYFSEYNIEIICDEPGLKENQYIQITKISGNLGGHINVCTEGSKISCNCQFATENFAAKWEDVLNTNYLAQIVGKVASNRFMVYVIYNINYGIILDRDTLEIALADRALGKKGVEETKRNLENYILHTSLQDYLLVKSFKYNEKQDSFMLLYRDEYRSVIERRRSEYIKEANDEKIWVIDSTAKKLHNNRDSIVKLWPVKLKINDITTATAVRESDKVFLKDNLGVYIDIWKKYAEIEKQLVDEEVNAAGIIDFFDAKPSQKYGAGYYELQISNKKNLQTFIEHLQIVNPDKLVQLKCEKTTPKGGVYKYRVPCICKQYDQEIERLIIEKIRIDREIPDSGIINIDVNASEKQYDRRMLAINRIVASKAAMPGFVRKLEGVPIERRVVSDKLKTPFSDAVKYDAKRKGKSVNFTLNQLEAINIALNTPDFAIIQGPPGTGKTTVINAIMNALSDQEKDKELFYAKNLVTAYQQDATKNMAEKLQIYGLPTPEYMGAKNYTEKNMLDKNISRWIEEKKAAINKEEYEAAIYFNTVKLLDDFCYHENRLSSEREKFTYAAVYTILLNIEEKIKFYIKEIEQISKSEETEQFGKDEDSIIKFKLDNLKREAQNLSNKLDWIKIKHSSLQSSDNFLQCYIPRIRCFPDSVEALSDISDTELEQIQNILTKIQLDEDAVKMHEGQATAVDIASQLENIYELPKEKINFSQVKLLKCQLIVALKPSNELQLRPDALQKDLLQFLFDAKERLEMALSSYGNSDENVIMSKYIDAFNYNQMVLQEDIRKYCSVIAATHQKTNDRGDDISLSRGTGSKEEEFFDNVLIDEAARSTPCDLLIPMACAKNKIILVGDHRQLPQFINDKVYERLDAQESGAAETMETILEKTMFEYLVKSVKKLEQNDGCKRFITLDTQYRMPKILGDIVSENFYGGKLKTPFDKAGSDPVFIPDAAKRVNMLWYDVPRNIYGNTQEERTASKSLKRDKEIEATFKLVKSCLEDSETAKCSIGIVSFYGAQVSGIAAKLRKENVIDANNVINKEEYPRAYADGDATDKVIRIGTVDSYQGLEFDIVILSMVRSNSNYKYGRHSFGFLNSDNRMCVALSRAKRCMIIIGDKAMLKGQQASEQVKALVAFLKKCQEGGDSGNAAII